MSKKQALTSRLFDAMVDNDIPKVQSILAQGVAINQGERDQTPLMYAAYWGKTEIVKLLLVHNPEINKQDDSGCNALLLALKSLYKQEIIEMLLDAGADVNMPDKDGMTPFLQAASSSDLSLIKLMLKKGAHVHSQSNDGKTALIYAVSRTLYNPEDQEKQAQCIKLFLQHGVAINHQDNKGKSAFLTAVDYDNPKVVEILLAAGADVSQKNAEGKTALTLASLFNMHEIAKMLVQYGAPLETLLDAVVVNDCTKAKEMLAKKKKISQAVLQDYIHKAVKNGFLEMATLLINHTPDCLTDKIFAQKTLWIAIDNNDSALVQKLIALGVPATVQDEYKTTSLLHALAANRYNEKNITDLIHVLLNAGVDVNKPNYEGWTPLMTAAENGNTELVTLLLAHGATVDKKNMHASSPLMRAVGNGHTNIAKILLEAGADINHKNRYGATALILASGSRGSKELVELLLEYKALVDTKDKEGKNALYYAQANNKLDIVALLKNHTTESSL